MARFLPVTARDVLEKIYRDIGLTALEVTTNDISITREDGKLIIGNSFFIK